MVVVIVAVRVVYSVKICGTNVSVTTCESAVPVMMVAKDGRGIGLAPDAVLACECTNGRREARSTAPKEHLMVDNATNE